MRKITFLFCVLMIVPTLVLASGDMVSISELRQQVEMMGRWTKNYDTPNGEVSVDIPVIVPDVDELPILEIQAVTPEDDGFSWDENECLYSFKGRLIYRICRPQSAEIHKSSA